MRTLLNLKISNHIEIRRSGEEALDFLIECINKGKAWPELIFIEIHMDDLESDNFLEKYALLSATVTFKPKVIFLSSSVDKRNQYLCEQYAIDGYFDKPLTKAKLNLIMETGAVNVYAYPS